jgi:hypothetical protein
VLKKVEAGAKTKELCRVPRISEARKLKELQAENGKVKRF